MNVTEAYDTHTHTEKGEEKLRFYVGIQIDGKIPKYNWIRKSWDCLLFDGIEFVKPFNIADISALYMIIYMMCSFFSFLVDK